MKAQTREDKPKTAPREDRLTHIRFNPKLLERIDEFRWKNRMPSRNEAVAWLVERMLDQKPKVNE